jgi:hypothetical protein
LAQAAASNEEMRSIFVADQKAREGDPDAAAWVKIEADDEARRVRTKALLDAGALTTGDDYFHAAFIFQHGRGSEDYLMAHNLAVIAVARGKEDATWIAAATLDRYLMSIGRPQIFGTQFKRSNGDASQEPYDRAALSDAMRKAMGVPPQAEQEDRRKQLDAQWKQKK